MAEAQTGTIKSPSSSQLQQETGAGKVPALVKDVRSPSGPNTLGIVVGSPSLTESTIAFELSTVLMKGQETGPNGELALRVLPMMGQGGVQDVRDVLTLPGADMAIVSAAVLERLAETQELGDIKRKLVVYVAPLYMQEVHLLAGPDIKTINDLKNKTVNAGQQSGAFREFLTDLGAQVSSVTADPKAAVELIRKGEIAATIVTSGKPIAFLSELEATDGVHLLPLPAEALYNTSYVPAILTNADYPNLIKPGQSIETVAATAVLIAYNWPAGSQRHRLVADFVQALFTRISEFQADPRHPKWREVNLAATLPTWRRFAAAERWLGRARDDATSRVTQAEFERFLTTTGSVASGRAERERLFRDFLRWRQDNAPAGIK